MSNIFNADEVLQIAAQMERNGATFYTRAAAVVTDPSARELFASLARMEVEHEGFFGKLAADSAARSGMTGGMDEETAAYLHVLADSYLFLLKNAEKISASVTLEEILHQAIALEKESIGFYQGVREVVPAEYGRDKVEELIREEIRHVNLLGARLRALPGYPSA